MAERDVDELIRALARIVAEDIRGYVRLPEGLPPVSGAARRAIEPLAVNRDRPERLVPGQGEADRRPEIWRGLAEVTARTVAWLTPEDPYDGPPAAVRFGQAGLVRYAEVATPRLIRQKLPDGVAEALGPFPEPSAAGDVAAVGDILRELSRRTGEVSPGLALSEDQLLTALASSGRYFGQEAAGILIRRRRLVLDQDGEFSRQSPHDESEIADRVTPELESGLDTAAGADWAAPLLDRASAIADRELHQRFPDVVLPLSAFRDLAGDLQGRPESVQQLVARIHLAVGELTGAPRSLWSGQVEVMRSVDSRQVDHGPDGHLELTKEAMSSLEALTVDGPLTPEQVAAAQQTMDEISRAFTRMAVPDDYPRSAEWQADQTPIWYDVSEPAVTDAFVADNRDAIRTRVLPADLAAQLSTPEPGVADSRYADVARGLASAVDTATRARPGETLRQMAGQGRPGFARPAADGLVRAANVPAEFQAYAVDTVAGRIELGFERLPAELASWKHRLVSQAMTADQTASVPAQLADESRAYGARLCRNAAEFLERYAPATGPKAQSQSARFAAADPAMTSPSGIQAPGATPAAGRGSANQQEVRSNEL